MCADQVESNIIFLTFLIARNGQHSVHRAFPSVRIVTASIDSGLHEMRLPLTNPVMGEAQGEADFAVRLVDSASGTSALRVAPDVDGSSAADVVDDQLAGGKAMVEGFKMHQPPTDTLRFSRRGRRETVSVTEKRAWVVSPGMGHIG